MQGKANTATSEDRVNRDFHTSAPIRLLHTDITEHNTREGRVYCAVVMDVWSPLVTGWSSSHRITADIVVEALQMAHAGVGSG